MGRKFNVVPKEAKVTPAPPKLPVMGMACWPPTRKLAGRPLKVTRRGSANNLAKLLVRSASRKFWKPQALWTKPRRRLVPGPVVARELKLLPAPPSGKPELVVPPLELPPTEAAPPTGLPPAA